MPPFLDSASQRSQVLHYSEKMETAHIKHHTDNHIAFIRYVLFVSFATEEEPRKERRKDGRN
jgi:hypothetical protein